MEFIPIKTQVVKPGDDLVDVVLAAMSVLGENVEDHDILVIAESVVATSEGRIVALDTIGKGRISDEARELATRYEVDPRETQLVLEESEEVYGGVRGVLLARVHGLLIANAGIDASNAGGDDLVVLLPKNPLSSAKRLRAELEARTGKTLGVVLADSRVQPLKRGVAGVAVATAGIEPVEDCRGRVDLFGRPLKMTFRAVADDLASAAQLLFGEADEQIPVVLVRGAPVEFTDDPVYESMTITPEQCLYINALSENLKASKN
ncbi:MAG: coenzyme F420-0:L-glutamate ligase [Promethearchaeota archaeon]